MLLFATFELPARTVTSQMIMDMALSWLVWNLDYTLKAFPSRVECGFQRHLWRVWPFSVEEWNGWFN